MAHTSNSHVRLQDDIDLWRGQVGHGGPRVSRVTVKTHCSWKIKQNDVLMVKKKVRTLNFFLISQTVEYFRFHNLAFDTCNLQVFDNTDNGPPQYNNHLSTMTNIPPSCYNVLKHWPNVNSGHKNLSPKVKMKTCLFLSPEDGRYTQVFLVLIFQISGSQPFLVIVTLTIRKNSEAH